MRPTLAGDGPRVAPGAARRTTTWESVLLTRRADRPGVRELLALGADDVLPLSGTGDGERDAGLFLALTSFDGTLLRPRRPGPPQPVARHSMGPAACGRRDGACGSPRSSASRWSRSSTPRAPTCRPRAEEGALAGEIARCLADMSRLTVPTVAVLLGQGCGGGALALLPGRRVIAAEHAWLSPLPPEGASAIVHHDTDHAAAAGASGSGSRRLDLLDDGIVHAVVPEVPAAHEDPAAFVRGIVTACAAAVRELAR